MRGKKSTEKLSAGSLDFKLQFDMCDRMTDKKILKTEPRRQVHGMHLALKKLAYFNKRLSSKGVY